jgi:DNA polymerase III subunit gamma/tau
MSYHALARKYRPSTFEELVGQQHVSDTLRAALRKDKLSHAYLFSGPRGCGKTTIARLLAKALNCSVGDVDQPCGTCDTCNRIADGSWLDVLEIDAASHTGVDNIRELRDMAQLSPSRGSSRVFIIDEVHMLSKGAFNALLKILEEPPPNVFFFFATTEPNKIPRTILSRCQRFDFRLLSRDELSERLRDITKAEGLDIDDDALRLIVAQAEGSMRDGLSSLDQVIAACDGKVSEADVVDLFGLIQATIYTDINSAIIESDAAKVLQIADTLVASGQNLDDFAGGLVNNFRNLLLLKVDPKLATGVSLPEEQIQILLKQSEHFHRQDLLALLDRASRGFERIHRSIQPRALLEALLVELTLMESRVLLSELVQRLNALSSGSGGPIAPATGGRRQEPSRPVGQTSGQSAASVVKEAVPVMSAASTVPGWNGFIESMLGTAPAVAACLMEGVPSPAENGKMTVMFPAEKSFQLKQVQREMGIIEKAAMEHLGAGINLQIIKKDNSARKQHREQVRKVVAPTEYEMLDKAREKDKKLDKLVELIGGEVVPEAEQEDWQRKK